MSLTPSSPRLPSPPPPAEIQLGPQSPSLPNTAATRQAAQMEQANFDANSKRRIHKGTKAADMAGPPLVPLNELDSAFQLQEHLAAMHYFHTQSSTQPMTRTTSAQLATAPNGIDRTLWLYELCRFLISQCNTLIVGFLFDTPACSAVTCPEMRASEWQFLCAVHEQPKSCCAIDYCCHTLDWAANVVTNPKLFPSRFVMHSDAQDKGGSVKALINVFRRLHRIFAHAWFQHRGVFWSVESQGGLYVFFKTVCDMYDLLPAENYKLPPEAEGLEGQAAAAAAAAQKEEEKKREQAHIQSMMSRPMPQRNDSEVLSPEDENYERLRNNTRRHIRSSPSTGSAVTTVMEADEEDGESGRKAKESRVPAPEPVEEEPEMAEVPVIVEHGMVDEPETLLEDDSTMAKPSTVEQESSDGDGEAETTVLEADNEHKPEAESSSEDEIKSSEDEDEGNEAENKTHSEAKSADTDQDSDDDEKMEELDLPLRLKKTSTKGDDLASTSVKDFADSSTAEPTPDASPESSEAGGSDKAEPKAEAKTADAEDEDEGADENDEDSDNEKKKSSQAMSGN